MPTLHHAEALGQKNPTPSASKTWVQKNEAIMDKDKRVSKQIIQEKQGRFNKVVLLASARRGPGTPRTHAIHGTHGEPGQAQRTPRARSAAQIVSLDGRLVRASLRVRRSLPHPFASFAPFAVALSYRWLTIGRTSAY